MKTLIVIATVLSAIFFVSAGCSSRPGNDATASTRKTIKSIPLGNLMATLSNSTGQLKKGDQEVTFAFTDSFGKPVDVGAVSLNFHMPAMGGMAAMNDPVTFTTTNTPGVYRGKVNIEVAGEWQGQLAYEGPAGKGKTTFTVSAQ